MEKQKKRKKNHTDRIRRILAAVLALTLILTSSGIQTLAEELSASGASGTELSAEAATEATVTVETEAAAETTPTTEAAVETSSAAESAETTAAEAENTSETESAESVTEAVSEDSETEAAEESADTTETAAETETAEDAVLDTSVTQEVFTDTDGALAVRYTIKVKNQSFDTAAEGVAVKAVLGESASYYIKEGVETTGLIYVEDLQHIPDGVDLDELSSLTAGELALYEDGSAVIWQDQTIAAGGELQFIFCAHAAEGVLTEDDLPALYFVNGERLVLTEENSEWKNTELLKNNYKTTTIFTAECGDITVTAELTEALPENCQFVVKEITASSADYDYDDLLSQAESYLAESDEQTEDIDLSGPVVLDMYFADAQGNEIEISGTATVTVSFGDGSLSGENAAVVHITEEGAEDVLTGTTESEDGMVSEVEIQTDSFSPFVIYAASTVSDDGDTEEEAAVPSLTSEGETSSTALKAYADALFADYGLTMTISQSPAGGNEVESGDAITWYVTISIPVAENYSGFSSYNKTLYDSYDNLTVELAAPDGITISNMSASEYNTSIRTDADGNTTAVVSFGNVTANAQTISFSVTGYIDADPAPETGTTYTLTTADITYSTDITVLDRDSSNAEVATYNVTGTTATDLSNFTLTAKTDDTWSLTKTQSSYSVSGDTLTVEYNIELLMNEYTQDSEYTANGRVNFADFSIVDTPTITGADGTVYYPTSVTAVNNTTKDTSNNTVTGEQSVTITSYADLDDSGQTETTAAGVPIEGTVPFHTTYTVTVTYDASQFTSQFYDVKTYTMSNTAKLAYTLEYAEGTTPVTGTDTKTATGTYFYAADPASIDLEKYIQSIYGGGNYLTGTSLDSEYTGNVSFKILDGDGNAAELYVLVDTDSDGTKEYVKISNVVTISRDASGAAFYVTYAGENSATAYDGLLYLNGGTYSIEETANTIANTSFTEFTGDSGTTLTADENNKKYSFTLTAGQAATINAYNTETRGSISFNKSVTNYDGTSATGNLAGAVFGIYTDASCTIPVTDSNNVAVTATSDSQGIVTFTKLDPGTYYIKETTALEGCLLDSTVYTANVTANNTTTTFSDGSGSVYNKKNAAALTFEKYLLSTNSEGNLIQVAVDQTRIDSVFNKKSNESQVFVLQYSTDGTNWTTLTDRTFTLYRNMDSSDVTISSAELSGLPVYTDSTATTAYQYRIVEYLPSGYSLADISGVTDDDISATEDSIAGTVTTKSFTLTGGDTTVSLTNQTTGEISVYKQYVQANADGAITSSANDSTAVTVYLLTKSTDGSYSYVATATNNGTMTGSDGYATVTGVNILGDNNNTAQVYYWAEATNNSAYSSYALQDGQTVTVNVNGTSVEMYLLDTAAYASAYESTSTKTTLTNILPYVRVKLTKKSSTTGAYVSGAGYTVYRVKTDDEGNETEVLYTDSLAQNTLGTIASSGSTLVLEAGYVYHVYETAVPDNYTGLTNADDYNTNGEGYVTVDLTRAVPDESRDNGVLQGTYAAEATFIDEPYPTFRLTKNLVSVNGSSVSTSSYGANFTVYRSETADGTYELYSAISSYTANTTVNLEPGYYYAFVENVASDVISPEIYPGVSNTNSSISGGTLKEITLDDNSTVYAFVTSSVVEATNTTTSYSIGTVTNYENTSSIRVTKYAYTSSSSSSITLDGAVIGLYCNSSCEDQYLITSGTTSGGTVTFKDLAIYTDDSNSEKVIYYIKEISAPTGYFVDDTVYEVTLMPGAVSTVSIYDEQELSVSIPVIWENCLTDAQSSLEGATVCAYEVVTDDDGNTTYVLAGSAVSGSNGYATIEGLKHNTEYVFILGASGVTDETAENYPLYASEDGSEDYLIATTVTTDEDGNTTVIYSEAPQTLTSLDGYQAISYAGCTDLSEDSVTITTALVNHLLYLQIKIQKYCTKNHGTDRQVGLYDSEGNVSDETASGAYYVNGAQFTLYRQALTEEEIASLAKGDTITITYDASKLEKVTDDEATDTGKADVDDTYNTAYVYWLVETATGTAHTWANTDYYYRILLYSDDLGGTIEVENATSAQSFTANKTVYLNVENTCGSGSHEYLLTTIYMNKWAGYYDEFSVDTEDYSPLSGVTFSFSLKNNAGATVGLTSNTTDGDIAVQYYDKTDSDGNTQADNDAGQMSVMFKFPLLLNEWVVAVANASDMSVTSITDITSDSTKLAAFNNITGSVWNTYADMLYVSGVIDASSMSELTDLAANDGAVAKLILNGYAANYSSTKIDSTSDNGSDDYVSAMENVLGSYYTWEDFDGNTQSLGYKSYYAHIVLTETNTTTSVEYGNYALNTTDYELYLQFRPTGSEGSANIKYFYLDSADRTDYYYDSDPSGVSTKVLDESFDNTTREQIVNMPVLNQSVTITKYGYTLNDNTAGKTDDALDTYFAGTDGSRRIKITASFYVQRYDGTTGEWKYYDTANNVYVDDADKSSALITTSTDGWSGELAIGWYRLIEVSAGSGYEVILDGTQVGVSGSSDSTEAVRYFWVKTVDGSNAVNVYDPDSIDLLIHKYSLSGTEITSGVTITLTGSDGTEKTASWNDTKNAWVIENLPAGTYTVTETVTNMSVTDAYFQSFKVTVGYDREAEAEAVDLTYSAATSVTQYATYVTGVSASISEQVDCTNNSTEDSITANEIDSSGATATLKMYNPSTGSITITKTDANDSSTTLQNAKFALYYQKFDVDGTDAYVADTSSTPTYTSGSSEWTKIGEYTTGSDGTVTASGLTPGWYAIVETSAPSGYELYSNVQVVAVVADMAVDQSGTHTKTNNGKVSVTVTDVKKVNLSVTKIFNPNEFKEDLQDEAKNYSVTFGLYVYDTSSSTYISANSLGLTDTDTVTVTVTDTAGGSTFTTNTGTWYNLIQMDEYLEGGVYTLEKDSTTYTLDGNYYIREISVTNKDNPSVVYTDEWWISGVSMSTGSGLTVDSTAVTDGSYSYYKVSGFKDNAAGTVTFTNDVSYATVEILKTDDSAQANYLAGATFTVYSDADCTDAVATGTTAEESGTCTITVPVNSTTGTTFYIKETVAPTGYTLNEDTITVTLTSGQKVSYTNESKLKITDSNGVYVKLTKYDNIHGYSTLSGLSNVTFTLLRSEDNGATWSVLRTYTTDSEGLINFSALRNSEGVIYMLAETTYDTDAYDGLESVWYTVTSADGTETTSEAALTQSTVTVITGDTETSYTGYQFSLQGIASGSTYQIYAYNQPKPEVTFIKKGDGSEASVPTATLEIYSVDANSYKAGQTLTSDEVTAATNAKSSELIDTLTTTVVSGAEYSSVSKHLSAGTYLVVETETSNSNYVINKDDADEVWYQIIEVPADGTKEMTVTFVNVTQEYDVDIKKTGTTELANDILSSEADLEYTLDVNVTASGPISGLTVTDSGLVVTKVYSSVGSSATTNEVSGTEAEKYLEGDYGITSVKIPVDAIYKYDSLVFTSGDKTNFTQNIKAKVTFTYKDGSTEELTAILANVTTTDGYWTVMPTYSNKKAVSFTVTWYDENLKTNTGYELGSDFEVSGSGLDIFVSMHIDEQEGGTTNYYAVAEIKNNASVTYDYNSWDTTGTATASKATDDTEVLTTVPNVSAAQMTITKNVENETSATRNTSNTAIIGDTLLYTITLTNSSSSLSMDNPVILDLLPQGLVAASAADENSFIANVTITDSTKTDSTLAITNVWRTSSDGYTLLEIVTSGSIAPGETVTITLEAVVDSTVLNYFSSNASMTNNVWMTSSDQGTVYHDNAIGSVFMGNTGSWAGNYTDPTTENIMATLLANLGFTGYGYISDAASINYEATSTVNLLKEVQGDQDEADGNWYYGDEGGTVTANTDEKSSTDDGYANFRLTVTNMTDGQDLTNIVLMDIVPKEDGASFNTNIDKEWSLIFDSITSVTVDGTDLDESHYTLWYYTGDVTTSTEVEAMQTAFSSDAKTGWVTSDNYSGDMSAVTAFAVVFDSTVSLGTGHKLQLIYKATVPLMTETEASNKAHLATYNDFTLTGDLVVSGTSNVVSSVSMYSNYVYALLSTEPVGVGGMFWIDADGDGIQDSEDVDPNSYVYIKDDGTEGSTASTYNSRTNNYSDYSVVQTLLSTASIQLLTYNGSTNSVMTTGTLDTSSWRFLFTGLASANISSAYTDATAYNSSGILWSTLAGASTASWYQLRATIAGNGSIKYSLTNTTSNVTSYDPDVMYSANNSSVGDALIDSNFSAGGSTETTSRTITGSAITTGSTTATSENFFLYGMTSGNALWNLSEDIGVVIYRDLTITKKDNDGSSPEAGSTFAVYGPYAENETITELTADKLVETYTLQNGETSHKFENLLYFQKYVIVETSADSSYELALATATGTNVSEIEAGITVVNEDSSTTTYQSAWILDIPTNDANQQNNNTDPTAYNNVTTDNMTVTNWKKGEVTVSKTVTGITTDKEFSFTLTLTDTDITDEIGLYTDESGTLKYTYTYTDGNGITLKDNQGNDRTGQFVVGSDGTYTFKLKDGESVTFSDIPEGLSYTVTEDAESGYTTTAKVTSGSGTVGQDEITVTGSIAEEGDVVAYTNDYSASAELTIQATKQLDNGLTASLPENTFSFTLTAATAATSTSGSAPVTTLTTDDDDSMTVYAATDGTVTFSSDTLLAWETSKDETYTLGVDYWYILQENELTGDYTTDSTIYCIKVNVKDVNYNGTLTVTETVYVGTLNTEDYTITFGAEASGDNLDNGGNPIFNDYSLINVYVSKDWEGDSNVSSVSRQNVTVLLQRRTAADTANNVKAGEWENIAVRVLTSADNWTYTWTGLSTTAAGMTTYYEYRVVEAALKEDAVTSSTDVDDYTAVESGTVSGANGTEYTVSISAPTSYSNAAGSTNSWTLTNTLKTTTLTVKKKVNGSTEDQKTSFTFTAEFKLGGSELAGTYSFQKYDASGNKLEESGDFGEIDLSSESELTFTLKHDQYIEISGLPVGTAYTVTEDSSYSGSYSTAWSDTDGQTESTLVAAGTLTQDEDENDASVTLTFTNTKKNGLNIEKVQSGGSISDTFIVTVLVWNTDTETIDDAVPYSGSYTLYASASDTTGTTETTENGTITFTDGQRIYIDLDYTQSYQVTEAQETGYEVPQYSTDNQTKWSTDAVTGTGKSPDYIYVKNQYKTGDLVITKNAEGGYSDAVFTFEVDLGISETDKKTEYTVSYTKVNESGDIVSAQADTTITSSNNTITLQDGWTATITGIDIGKTVTVTETGVSSASATNAGITASLSDYSTQVNDVDGDTYTANISNKTQTYTAVYTNVYETGDLTVSKTVTGIDESVGHDFEFTLTLTDPTGTIGLYTDENGTQKYTYTYTNENGEVLQDAEGKDRTGTFVVTSSEANSGTCTFNLKDGEYITFSNIPVNLTYTVTETEESGYTTTAAVTKNNSASSGTISNSDGQTATGSILQEGDRVAYKNAYSASADLTIEATKLLDDGRTTVPTNTFSFTLAAATDSTAVGATDTTLTRNTADSDVLTASAGIDGTVSFSSDDILKWTTSSDNGYYEDAVDYWFILEENDLTEPNASLYETDDTIYCIKVTVQDVEHNGTLTLTLDVYTGTEENGVITVNSEPENSDLIEAAIIETGSQSQKAQAARALLVFNNYSTISVSVEKLWDGDEDVQDLTRPASVLAVLQRQSTVTSADGSSTSTGEWENQDVQELNKAGSWSYTWNGLRTTEKDAEGNTIDYTYRVVEAALSSSYDTEQTGTPDAAEYEELTTFSGEGGSTYVVEVSEKETEAGSNEQSYEITNTLLTADLKVSKTVVGDSDDQADNSFTFTLSLTDDSESANALTGAYDYEVYAAGSGDEADSLISSGTVTTDSDGNVVFAETVAGETTESASITLAHGQYLLIKDLPTGMRYTVTEAENASFSPSYRIDGAEAEVGNTAEGTISEAESINADAEEAAEETAGTEETNGIGTDVAFTNTKLNGLNIRKIQSGGSTDDSFSIRITVKEADAEEYTAYTGTYRIADSDGVYGEEQTLTADADGCISIKNGETIHIELPYDTGYIVTEQLTEAQEEAYEAPLYAMITADSDEADETDEESADYTETPAEGNSSTASAVYVKNQHETGSLTLTKQLEGSYEDAEFTFSVDLGIADDDLTQSYIVTYAETNASGETVKAKADTTISSANDGSADGNIVLSAGQTATITNIDTGKTITVKEVSAKVKIDGVTYTISLDEYSTYFNSSEEASTVYTDTLTTTEPDIAVTCRNVYKTGSITLQKVNGSDNGHLNEVITTGTAEFILFRKIGDTWHYMTGYDSSKSVDAATWSDTGYSSVSEIGTTAYEAIKAAIANGKSDAYVISTEKGVCTLENMEIGEYQILELTAPDGYVRKETATSLTLEETTETVISASVAIANKETETETTKETTKETTTTKGTETESETDTSSPQTGDNTPLEVYTVVMLAAAAVLLLLEERRRRKNA